MVARAAVPAERVDSVPATDRLIVALDVPTVHDAQEIVDDLGELVSFYKVGMELAFDGDRGFKFIRQLIDGDKKVFLDLKLIDIPNTVERAVRNLRDLGVSFLTVHGARQTIEAARRGRGDADMKLFCITVLTTWTKRELRDLCGTSASVKDVVRFRTEMAVKSKLDGVIGSARDIDVIKRVGPALLVVTPGIRPAGAVANDQKRIVTPGDAIKKGADHLVIGRPITQANDRRAAAKAIIAEMNEAAQSVSLAGKEHGARVLVRGKRVADIRRPGASTLVAA